MLQWVVGRFACFSYGLGRSRRTMLVGLMLASILATPALIAANITVNTATDDFGSVASNCSLREAIQSANSNADFGGCTHTGSYGTDQIALPGLSAGVFFNLTRVGTDDTNNNGDLDIAGSLTITGAGVASSAIRSNFSAANSDRFRIFQIHGGTVSLIDLTVRDGLEDGSVAGGGLRTEPNTSTTLTRVNVFQNSAAGNAGGILNQGSMVINDSIIRANQTTNAATGGGGIFNAAGASLSINDSQILDNIVDNGAQAFGGGIYSDSGATLFIDNCVIDGNRADGNAVVDVPAQGGGIRSLGSLSMVQSTVSNNIAIGSSAKGGGIHVEDGSMLVDRSVVFSNVSEAPGVSNSGAFGGGININSGNGARVIQDSVISSNQTISNGASGGGGLVLTGGARVVRSTIANNQTSGDGNGGGIFFAADDGAVINSTIINNQANGSGGGIQVRNGVSGGVIKIRNSTIAQNTSNADGNASGVGGGINIESGLSDVGNSVIADNISVNGGVECAGALTSVGNNLVRALAGCSFAAQASDLTNVAAFLAAAGNNGGPTAGSTLGTLSGMLTRAPLPNSFLIDRGDASGCKDANNQVLATDQVGRARSIDGPDPDVIARCDIGAIEYQDTLFANGFE